MKAVCGNTLDRTLTLGSVGESSTTADGTVGWTYTVSDNATDYLAAGQSATETFTLTIADVHGGTTTHRVVHSFPTRRSSDLITASGTTATGTVTEDATTPDLSTSGTIAF